MPPRNANPVGDGENCWGVFSAEQAGWAIDGAAYFEALRSSLGKAEHEILIVGWDIDSRIHLIRDVDHKHYPSPLCETLQSLVASRPELRIHVLSWDFAMVYLLERELLPAYRFGWQDEERLHFRLDNRHLTGASQHQKIVVVDGALAFCGGIDITKCRWDTPEHAPNDERRTEPGGDAYGPFHDVQAVVTGTAAGKLREIVNQRWQNATGESLPTLDRRGEGAALWPDNLAVSMENVDTAIARTWMSPDGENSYTEVVDLYLDMIAAARHSIYIENQYFTSRQIAEALSARLAEPDGPEIVMVLPNRTAGWLEQSTMDVLRNRALKNLRDADLHAHLQVCSPMSDALEGEPINVHAKIMVVDNRWLRIGSANLSGRSMGLDTECDLLFDTSDSRAAVSFCAQLLAEHLGAGANEVAASLQEDGLLVTIERFNDGDRRLDALHCEPDEWDPWLEPMAKIADLEKPLEKSWGETLGAVSESITNATQADTDLANPTSGQVTRAAVELVAARSNTPLRWLLLGFGLLMVGFWTYWAIQGSRTDMTLQDLLTLLREWTAHPLAPLVVLPLFVLGSLLVLPVTGMIALCALLFEPLMASTVAIGGTLLSTAATHEIGKYFSEFISARIPARVAKRISVIGASSDTWSLAGLRLVPIAPFTIVNLAAGVARVSLFQFLLGTLITMGPVIVMVCFSVDRARAALAGEPIFEPWIIFVIILAGIGIIGLRVLKKRREPPNPL